MSMLGVRSFLIPIQSKSLSLTNFCRQLFSSSTETTNSASNVTHTGQTFRDDDYRRVRFEDKEMLVNQQWAQKLVAEAPPVSSQDRVVSCDGGGGPLGHPKVFINLDKEGEHVCGYCGTRFFKKEQPH